MKNEYIGRDFHNLNNCEIWIDETKTLAQLSRLLDAYMDFGGQTLVLMSSKPIVERMLRAKVIVGFRITDPSESKDLQDWQVWFRKRAKEEKHQRNVRMAMILDAKPDIKQSKLACELKVSESTISKSKVWQGYRQLRKSLRSPGTSNLPRHPKV